MTGWPQPFGYCTPDQVAAQCRWVAKNGFTTTTQPTLAEVEGFITELSQLVDARGTRQGFTMPATTGAGYTSMTVSVLQTWVSIGVAGRVVMANENKVLEPGQRTTGQSLWQSFLKWLGDDEQISMALSQSDTQTAGLSSGNEGTDPDTGNDRAPLFRVQMRW